MRQVLIIITIFFFSSQGVIPQNSFINNGLPFDHGEELTFTVSYTWFFVWTDVGEVTFTAKDDEKLGRNAYHLHAYGKSFPFYDWFFKVRDVYESWVDQITLQPIYFNRSINEGGYTKENEYVFDWENNNVKARFRRRGGENRYYNIAVEPSTYDVVSAIYYSRCLDFSNLEPFKRFPIRVVLDREIFNVNYTFLQREEKMVKGIGSIKTLKFRVELIAGDVFKDGQYLYVWVTDDSNKVPLYIESPIRVGTIRARLTSFKGLKTPLNSEKR